MPEIGFEDEDLTKFGADSANEGLIPDDEIPEVKESFVKRGEIWQLGKHRLMCGDSTDTEQAYQLFSDQRVEITFTSPPYNLGKNMKLRGPNGGGEDSAYANDSDSKSEEEYLDFLYKFTNICLSKSDLVFINIQILAGNKFVIPRFWDVYKENLVDLMVWDKGHAQPAAAQRVLNSVWEFIFILSKELRPKRSIKTGPEFRGTIDNIYRLNPVGKKDPLASDHGAVFPVEFAQTFITRHSSSSVYDPFCGSGTTLIACEKTNRRCFGMELDPHYCGIIIERWQQFSGQKAIKI